MLTITFTLSGVLQSYGKPNNYAYRETKNHPTKSAILGLIAAALGIKDTETKKLQALNKLKTACLIINPGKLMTDYQTVHTEHQYTGKTSTTKLSWRDYLQDADFKISITGDNNQIKQIANALTHPVFQLYLGRKANVLDQPIQPQIIKTNNPINALLENYNKNKYDIYADDKIQAPKGTNVTIYPVQDAIGSFNPVNRYHQYRFEQHITKNLQPTIKPNLNLNIDPMAAFSL